MPDTPFLGLSGSTQTPTVAYAGTPGPGQPPNPWRQDGGTLYYDQGGVVLPSGVTGGDKGPGTLNVDGLFEDGLPITVIPTGPAGGDLAGNYPNPTVKASVGLTGSPTATTAAPGDSSQRIATTSFVASAMASGAYLPIGGGTLTGPLTVTGIATMPTITAPAATSLVLNAPTGQRVNLRINNADVVQTQVNAMFPATTNAVTSGGASNRWSGVYGVLGDFTGALTGTTATFSAAATTLTTTATTNGAINLRVAGLTRGLIVTSDAVGTTISGTDNTGVGSFQPLILGGSVVNLTAPLQGTTALFSSNVAGTSFPVRASNLSVVAGATAYLSSELTNIANGYCFWGVVNGSPPYAYITTGAGVTGGLVVQPTATFQADVNVGSSGNSNKLVVWGTSGGLASFRVTATATAKYIGLTPETATDVASIGYWTGAGYGTTNFQGPLTGTTATFSGTVMAPGAQIQMVSVETGAVATGTTILPTDDTIPQITEGDQYMTLAITPKSATSKLIIEVVWVGATSAVTNMAIALFQDSTANALAAIAWAPPSSNYLTNATLRHVMTSGITTPTTFRVRAGGGSAGTTTFNGVGGGRFMGGVMASSIVIQEVAP